MSRYASFVVVFMVLAIWYIRYLRALRSSGGAAGLMQKQLAEEFGLEAGEQVSVMYRAMSYLGPLRPGAGAASLVDRLANGLEMTNRRSALFQAAVTSRGRVLLSCEPLGSGKRAKKGLASTFGDMGSWFELYGRITALHRFTAAFPGVAFPAKEAPPSTPGQRWTLVVVEVTGRGRLSLWFDERALPAFEEALTPTPVLTDALPHQRLG